MNRVNIEFKGGTVKNSAFGQVYVFELKIAQTSGVFVADDDVVKTTIDFVRISFISISVFD